MQDKNPTMRSLNPAFELAELLLKTATELQKRGIPSPRLEAELIVAKVLLKGEVDRAWVYANLHTAVSKAEALEIQTLLSRRLTGEPLAYIFGEKEFYSLPFTVSSAVLTPRPETELLIDLVLKHFSESKEIIFADLGTGSGILAITLVRLFPKFLGFALDISKEALKVARKNALNLHVARKLFFINADMGCPPIKDGCLDLVISNPPYISIGEYSLLPGEVKDFEPALALLGGEDGLDLIRQLAKSAHNLLKPGGILVLETGSSQAGLGTDILKYNGFTNIRVEKDLAGLDRALWANKKC